MQTITKSFATAKVNQITTASGPSSIPKLPQTKESEHAILKQHKTFDSLTDLVNYPVEVKFQLTEEVVNTDEEIGFLRGTLVHGLNFHSVQNLCSQQGIGGDDGLTACATLPTSRNNLGLRKRQVPTPPFPTQVLPESFVYRSYEFFHLNTIDVFGMKEDDMESEEGLSEDEGTTPWVYSRLESYPWLDDAIEGSSAPALLPKAQQVKLLKQKILKDFSNEWQDVTTMGAFPTLLITLSQSEEPVLRGLQEILPKVLKGYFMYSRNGFLFHHFNHLTMYMMSETGILDYGVLVMDCLHFLSVTLAWSRFDDTAKATLLSKSQKDLDSGRIMDTWYTQVGLSIEDLQGLFPAKKHQLRSSVLEQLASGIAIIHIHMYLKRALLRTSQISLLYPAGTSPSARITPAANKGLEVMNKLISYQKNTTFSPWVITDENISSIYMESCDGIRFHDFETWYHSISQVKNHHRSLIQELHEVLFFGHLDQEDRQDPFSIPTSYHTIPSSSTSLDQSAWMGLDLMLRYIFTSFWSHGDIDNLQRCCDDDSLYLMLNCPHLPTWSNHTLSWTDALGARSSRVAADTFLSSGQKLRELKHKTLFATVISEAKLLADHVLKYKRALAANNTLVIKDSGLRSRCMKEQQIIEIWKTMRDFFGSEGNYKVLSSPTTTSESPKENQLSSSSCCFVFWCRLEVDHNAQENIMLNYENAYRQQRQLPGLKQEWLETRTLRGYDGEIDPWCPPLEGDDEEEREEEEVPEVDYEGEDEDEGTEGEDEDSEKEEEEDWDEDSGPSDEDDDEYDPVDEQKAIRLKEKMEREIDFDHLSSEASDGEEESGYDSEASGIVYSDEDMDEHRDYKIRKQKELERKANVKVIQTSSGRLSRATVDLEKEKRRFEAILKKEALANARKIQRAKETRLRLTMARRTTIVLPVAVDIAESESDDEGDLMVHDMNENKPTIFGGSSNGPKHPSSKNGEVTRERKKVTFDEDSEMINEFGQVRITPTVFVTKGKSKHQPQPTSKRPHPSRCPKNVTTSETSSSRYPPIPITNQPKKTSNNTTVHRASVAAKSQKGEVSLTKYANPLNPTVATKQPLKGGYGAIQFKPTAPPPQRTLRPNSILHSSNNTTTHKKTQQQQQQQRQLTKKRTLYDLTSEDGENKPKESTISEEEKRASKKRRKEE